MNPALWPVRADAARATLEQMMDYPQLPSGRGAPPAFRRVLPASAVRHDGFDELVVTRARAPTSGQRMAGASLTTSCPTARPSSVTAIPR
jgi:hypothetical protein